MRDERGALIFIQIALRPDTARPLGRAGAERGEARPKKYFLGDAFARWPSLSFTVELVRSFDRDTPLPARPRDNTARARLIHTLRGRTLALVAPRAARPRGEGERPRRALALLEPYVLQ